MERAERRSKTQGKGAPFDELIFEILEKKPRNKDQLHNIKKKFCAKYSLGEVPSDADVLSCAKDDGEYELLLPMLKTKLMRTISGVAPVAVMTSPADCPHGKCMYCPGGVANNSPQSYTGKEPAALRAAHHNFDPFAQTKARIEQIGIIGHPTDKIDLIVMGGTFPARDAGYQDNFIKRCFDAMNEETTDGRAKTGGRRKIEGSAPHSPSKTLEDAQMLNETAKHRCIGMTIETRPDWCREQHIDRMLSQGCTRVEIGVQSTSKDVLWLIERGHTIEDTMRATQLARDAGLKVGYHMMPFLPGTKRDEELGHFLRIFEDDNFKPDMLKIYPTLVMKGTKLHDAWTRGDYSPPTNEEALSLVMEVEKNIPRWVRIQRVERDIPIPLIDAGVKHSNLREMADKKLEAEGNACRCIRCREAGHRMRKGGSVNPAAVKLQTIFYDASGGEEAFVSFDDTENDALIGYARLRRPSKNAHREEIRGNKCAIVRELKVVGAMVPLGKKPEKLLDTAISDGVLGDIQIKTGELQHTGFGGALMKACELIAIERWGAEKLFVNSGVGAREYYKKLGYAREGPYVGKNL